MAFDVTQPAYVSLRGRITERTLPTLAWVGSGLSAAAGVPTWPGLRARLVEVGRATAATLSPDAASRMASELDSISSERDYWLAFQRLEHLLGRATYRETIRESLAAANSTTLPSAYRRLWELPLSGVLTLNLDRLVSRGAHLHDPNANIVEFSGRDVPRLLPLLNSPRRFIANLHGVLDDAESWIFTYDELQRLMNGSLYQNFLRTCFGTFSNVFFGISTDDVAVSRQLQWLTEQGAETPTHYWVTSRNDERTHRWAESVNVRLITYRASGGDHSEVLQFFDDLCSYVPVEASAVAPVTLERELSKEGLPPASELAMWSADRIREVLNAHAQKLLGSQPGDAEYLAYEAFTRDYDEAIYRAWYTPRSGANMLLGYRLDAQVARGAFGRVYRAIAPNGDLVAVKVLLEDIRSDPELLKSFRRGVRSMRIVSEHGVAGVVNYLEASEIPAFVTMEWVEGPNLEDAKNARRLDNWYDILAVAADLTDVLRRAHALPERVLHRDLRPANVMLRNFWTDPDDWEVVVLDFDLSWHRGAEEKSVVYTTAAGYLAPEQVQPVHGATTRSAAVDAFGLGMTLLFLCSGHHPNPNEHLHRSYESDVCAATASIQPADWVSLPARFARVILAATRHRQAERWDLSEIAGELARLREGLSGSNQLLSPELVTEELAARTGSLHGYAWTPDTATARRELASGVVVQVQADEPAASVCLSLDWAATGMEQRQGLHKYVSAAATAATARLRSAGFERIQSETEGQSMHLRYRATVSAVAADISRAAKHLDEALATMRFSDD
ncbi:MAG: eukaryotic-like serine/threonine-protein kinase [Frankiaceae bacterium]|jgi:hypothetical protein|nr:eukaryotic-like serine/threonine-protein kinase [Frankiaceae bacterium]